MRNTIFDSIIKKRSRAGLSIEIIENLVLEDSLPEQYVGSIEGFTKNEQLELISDLYEELKDLPPLRLKARDNHLIRKGKYSEDDKEKRDSIYRFLMRVRGDLDDEAKEQIKKKALKDVHLNDSVLCFNLVILGGILKTEEFEEILQQYLEEKYSGDYEDQMDLGAILANAENIPEIKEDLVKEIWDFAKNDGAFDSNSTYSSYERALENVKEESHRQIFKTWQENFERRKEIWEEKELDDFDELLALQDINFSYLNNYFNSFCPNVQEKFIAELSESTFERIEEIQEFINER